MVFEEHADLDRRIDDESVAIDENSVLVLRQGGPRGAPGMAEWGAAPIPARLLKHVLQANEGVDFAQSARRARKKNTGRRSKTYRLGVKTLC